MSTENTAVAGAGQQAGATGTTTAQASTAQAPTTTVAGADPKAAAASTQSQTQAPADDVISAAPEVDVSTFDFAVPEGMKKDDAMLGKFKPIAKELGLKPEGAQKLVDLWASTVSAQAKAAQESWANTQKGWKESVKTDKELGGQNFEATRVDVGRFFNAFDKDGSIRKEISSLGLSNHPALVRLAVRAAKLMREDGGGNGNGGASSEKSADQIMRLRYPSMFKD